MENKIKKEAIVWKIEAGVIKQLNVEGTIFEVSHKQEYLADTSVVADIHRRAGIPSPVEYVRELAKTVDVGHEVKVCGKCHKRLPVSDFNKRKASEDGLQWSCRECNNLYGTGGYGGVKHRGKYLPRAKVCNMCKKELPASSFYKVTKPNGKKTLHTYCMECSRERTRVNEERKRALGVLQGAVNTPVVQSSEAKDIPVGSSGISDGSLPILDSCGVQEEHMDAKVTEKKWSLFKQGHETGEK